MKKLITLIVLIAVAGGQSFSQCVENPTNRVLLAGDSWAAFMFGDATLNEGLKNVGHSDKRSISNVIISENGAETDDFLGQEKQDAIQAVIDGNPSVDIIHMSIGGNDVLGDWNISFTQQETDSLENAVAGRLEDIVAFLKSTRSDVHVFWPGYCYPNFEEVIEEIAPFQSSHPFFSTWDDMGQPNFLQLNTILNDFSDSVAAFANLDPRMDFVPAQGILQYHFGQQQALGVAPGGTYMPFEAPLPLGYPEYPSPIETMRLYAGIFTDCFHLSEEAYLVFFQYQAEKFYQKKLMDDMYELSEGGLVDGSVSSDGSTVSEEIWVGDDNGNEFATILTFDITGMADTTLQGASIFLRREELVGANPMESDIQVKMINGSFGNSADVEAGDFMESGTAEGLVCVFGSSEEDGHWVRLDLTADMLANMSNQSQVQFMIQAPGFTGGSMRFHDASDAEKAPVLNLNYGPEPSSVSEIRAARELPVYPIPTTGELTIDVSPMDLVSVEVLDVLGKNVLTLSGGSNRIDISSLNNGTYVLRITTKEGVSAKRIIKR